MDQYQDRITHLCRTRAAAVLIQHFSHGELQELIRFYETPVGRAYARVYRQLVTDLVRDPQRDALVHEIATQIRTDRMERLISIGTQ